ncbi:methylated-DNA--[protein]-cysteine S-methyltransferase [Companilactobacillus halodurans]|uniref:methylated-DNA--[protein]-cysteine S-methyltransferase n=1 Tax=Companilactobacillus halodurans TaxID=2584183 RepID=A0A5P0ZRS7_9LACO|nr:methylated-DNA--[protein]-cysteine S-methyltransferase [Companilactobacillus halodurans]MQS76902.1 methylated-DNA--[protein]-cysteine S-methyltransferase [Companilactobacillus halodurans]MQS98445.1 methylated-DNA--[protein]-cysteine S-methyltransferase [Companilactobacillus halodurans]
MFYHEFLMQGYHYVIAATDSGLSFVGSRDKGLAELQSFYPNVKLIDQVSQVQPYQKQIDEYLKGDRKQFTLKTDISGTDFQQKVWQALREIPYGKVRTYSEIAEAIDRPKAYRAVGTAIGKNPILMVVPCHRVLTKNHQLGGFRGGLAMKNDLLDLEKN